MPAVSGTVTRAVGKLYDFALELIDPDPATQPRAALNRETVEQYAEHMRDGAEFPPVVIFDERGRYWLADGWHRVEAARSIGWTHIRAEVREGSREDAILFGLSANAKHGLPRSNEDKRRAVRVALELRKLAGKPDREIAAVCAVSAPFVATIRRKLSVNGLQIPTAREVTRGGATYTMNVSTIGKGSGPEPAPVEDDDPEPRMAEALAEPDGNQEGQEETAAEVPAADRPEPGKKPKDQTEAKAEEEDPDLAAVVAAVTTACRIAARYKTKEKLGKIARRADPSELKELIQKAERLAKWSGWWVDRLYLARRIAPTSGPAQRGRG